MTAQDHPDDRPPDDHHPPLADPERHRPVRSFVLRQGRLTPAQARAFDQHWSRYGIDYQGRVCPFDAVFGLHADRVLEIGFGNGEALLFAAANDPLRDHIGIEVHRPGVGRLLNALAEQNLDTVRVYNHDAVAVLDHEIAPGSLAEIRIYFPDPWHKKRHNKRRLIQPEFAKRLVQCLRPGGLLHLVTDWQPYAEHMLAVLDDTPGLRNRAGPGGFSPCPPWRPQTRFETRGLRLGHGVWDLLYDRVEPPTPSP